MPVTRLQSLLSARKKTPRWNPYRRRPSGSRAPFLYLTLPSPFSNIIDQDPIRTDWSQVSAFGGVDFMDANLPNVDQDFGIEEFFNFEMYQKQGHSSDSNGRRKHEVHVTHHDSGGHHDSSQATRAQMLIHPSLGYQICPLQDANNIVNSDSQLAFPYPPCSQGSLPASSAQDHLVYNSIPGQAQDLGYSQFLVVAQPYNLSFDETPIDPPTIPWVGALYRMRIDDQVKFVEQRNIRAQVDSMQDMLVKSKMRIRALLN